MKNKDIDYKAEMEIADATAINMRDHLVEVYARINHEKPATSLKAIEQYLWKIGVPQWSRSTGRPR